MRSISRLCAAVVTLPLLATVIGCPETDLVREEAAPVFITVRGEFGGNTRYTQGRVTISNVNVRPSDPAIQDLVGRRAFALLAFPVKAELTESTQFQTVLLTPGSYEVTRVTLSDYQVEGPVPGTPASCIENFEVVPEDRFLLTDLKLGVEVTSYTNLGTFDVSDSGGGFTIVIDADILGTALEGSVTCQAMSSCPYRDITFAPPCLREKSFSKTNFEMLNAGLVTVE